MSQQCTTKTLPSGEQVLCHPPCDRFPEGHRTLIPSNSMRARLDAAREQLHAAQDDLKTAQQERLHKAQQALAAGDAVPFEKRCI